MTEKIRTVLVEPEEISLKLIKKYLEQVEDIEIIGTFKSIKSANDFIFNNKPDFIIADISENSQKNIDEIKKIQNQLRKTKIIVTSYSTASSLIVKAFQAGARDFLIKPLIDKDFIKVAQKMVSLIKGNINDRAKCKVVTVFSNKGGVGKTVLATNIAHEIACQTKEKVALIDLNLQLGDITTFLELAPTFNASYVIKNLDKIDNDDILSTFEKYKDTDLYVLSDPQDLIEAQDVTSEDITNLLNVLKEIFAYIIIDTTSSFDERTITALNNSDIILHPMIINMPAIRNTQRCFDAFKKLNYHQDKIKIIANRVMENDEIKIDDVEKTLNQKVYFKIPNNYSAIIGAINKGYAVSEINSSSNIAKSFGKLAALLTDNFTYSDY